MTTAYMAKEFGWPVEPALLTTATGSKVAVFVCGVQPEPGKFDSRYVELFVCGASAPRGVVRFQGLLLAVWRQVEPLVAELTPAEVVEHLQLAQAQLELQWRLDREAKFKKGFEAAEEEL